MPKDKNNGREMTPDEKFRSFFSTTAVDIPEEMTRRDENQPEEKPQKRFGCAVHVEHIVHELQPLGCSRAAAGNAYR